MVTATFTPNRPAHTIWGFDCEFLPTGKAGDPRNVHSVQLSDGFGDHHFVESASDLKKWLHNRHRALKLIYGFNVLCDLGAIKEWLGEDSVKVVKFRGKLIGTIKYGSAVVKAFDSQPLLANFGLRRLADVGELVGVPKLPKPPFLGLRKWKTQEEHEQFRRYAVQDAIITSLATRWLIVQNDCDPVKYASAGSIAAAYFDFPKRHRRVKSRPLIPAIERAAGRTCAGRSEAFVTGFTPNAFYNDVKSLYPCSIVATRALCIDGIEACDFKDLAVNDDLNEKRFGWLLGTFETDNDLWGLPIHAKNVTYVTGQITGFYHTFDIAAAKAKIVHVSNAYKPIWRLDRRMFQSKFAKMLSKRVEGKLDARQARFAKAVLNSTYGKLGQSHPEAATTNYPAFSTILAHSHLIMSKLFDKCSTDILGMDTDSIFSQTDMTGTFGDLTDGEYSIPLIMEVKGKGDLAMFRAKTYMMRQEGKPIRVYGRHVWHYFIEDYFGLWERTDFPFLSRIEVKHTLKTRSKEALKLPLGFWREKPVKLTKEKISDLLEADNKRKRSTYDSFALFHQRRSMRSQAYTMNDAMFTTQVEYPSKSHEKFPVKNVDVWYRMSRKGADRSHR